MNLPDKKIVDFILKHHVLTLSTSDCEASWCCSCFYVYLKEKNILAFSSEKNTKHIRQASANQKVSGTIVLETSIIGKIQGIQFSGIIREAETEMLAEVRREYLKRFPYAILTKTELWTIDIDYIKFTDNRLGFGKKLIWTKE